MVYRGVSSPHKKLVISLWFALSLSLLKIVTLESPPRVFAPPSPTGMTTVTRLHGFLLLLVPQSKLLLGYSFSPSDL